MTIHPPVLFLGYASLTVPFAIAMAAMVRRDWDGWVRPALPWVALASVALAAGHHHGRTVGLQGAGLGRLLGLGPGRERLAGAVARERRAAARAARAERRRPPAAHEPVAGGDRLRARALRLVPDAQRRAGGLLGALLRGRGAHRLPAPLPGRGRGRRLRPAPRAAAGRVRARGTHGGRLARDGDAARAARPPRAGRAGGGGHERAAHPARVGPLGQRADLLLRRGERPGGDPARPAHGPRAADPLGTPGGPGAAARGLAAAGAGRRRRRRGRGGGAAGRAAGRDRLRRGLRARGERGGHGPRLPHRLAPRPGRAGARGRRPAPRRGGGLERIRAVGGGGAARGRAPRGPRLPAHLRGDAPRRGRPRPRAHRRGRAGRQLHGHAVHHLERVEPRLP